MIYNYTKTPFACDRLTYEIVKSSITIALDCMTYMDGALTIYFKANLPGGDLTTLNALVAAHNGVPMPVDTIGIIDGSKHKYNINTTPLTISTTHVVFSKNGMGYLHGFQLCTNINTNLKYTVKADNNTIIDIAQTVINQFFSGLTDSTQFLFIGQPIDGDVQFRPSRPIKYLSNLEISVTKVSGTNRTLIQSMIVTEDL